MQANSYLLQYVWCGEEDQVDQRGGNHGLSFEDAARHRADLPRGVLPERFAVDLGQKLTVLIVLTFSK